ncbi:MAG: glycoside hydrolase family 28 protein [Phycisphaerae bacterium]
MNLDIRDHGAVADDRPQTEAIQRAIDTAAPTGGRVTVPPGTWLTGTVWLRSGVELHLSRGAVLKGTNNPADYPAWDAIAKGVATSRRVGPRRMVGAVRAEDVAVTGMGVIDGDGGCGGQIKAKEGNEAHPQNLQFIHCSRVTVQGVALRFAGSWMQQYHACRQVRIAGVSVWNHGNRTNDGMDIDGCEDVRISDCDIDSHDDALVFKSTGPSPCRNILVTHCRLRSNCHGIKFGTESVGGFQNIRVHGCVVSPSHEPDPMAGYPQGRPVITGCALECVDGGLMRNIQIDGLIVERVFAPVFVKLGNRLDRRLDEETPPEGVIEDVSITNVLARQAGPIACSVTGYPGNPVRRVHLGNIRIEQRGGTSAEDILRDVPEHSDGYPEVNMFTRKTGKQLPAYGFYLRHVDEITLRDVAVRLAEPDAREPIVAEEVHGLHLDHVTGADGREVTL